MQPSLALRAPLPCDYAALAAWIPDADACLKWAGPRVVFPFTPAALPGMLDVAGGRSWFLAAGQGPPAAFGQHWVLVRDAVHLGRIIVAPGARGAGLGQILCRLLMAQALHETGARHITLRVYRDNRAALQLYTGLGFVPVESDSNEAVLSMAAQAGKLRRSELS